MKRREEKRTHHWAIVHRRTPRTHARTHAHTHTHTHTPCPVPTTSTALQGTDEPGAAGALGGEGSGACRGPPEAGIPLHRPPFSSPFQFFSSFWQATSLRAGNQSYRGIIIVEPIISD